VCLLSCKFTLSVCEKILAVVASVGNFFRLSGMCKSRAKTLGPGEYFWLLEALKGLIGAGPSVEAHLDCA